MTERFVQASRTASRKNAFSLVEVVLALAVTAVSIVAIISLFPVGLNTALEGRRASRATYLAQQIVSDLRSSPYTNVTLLYRGSDGTLTNSPAFSLGIPSTNYLTCDAQENVMGSAQSAQYTSGDLTDTNASYLVQITVQPALFTTNLATVSMEVSAPAQATLNARSRYGFQTMIGNRQ